MPRTMTHVDLQGMPSYIRDVVQLNCIHIDACPAQSKFLPEVVSVGRWGGDTLVVETITVDGRLMNFERWHPSDQQRIVERFTRTSANYLTYEMVIDDPVVLAEPYIHVPRTWTLAQSPDDVWTEYLCTANEEPIYMRQMDPQQREAIEGGGGGRGGRGGQ